MGWHDGRAPDPAELAGRGDRDDHAAVETTESSPPLRCEHCQKGRHSWRATTLTRRLYAQDVRLYRMACDCSACHCDDYRAFVETDPAPQPYALRHDHWAVRLLARAVRVPEEQADEPSTKQLSVIPMHANDTAATGVGPRSRQPLPGVPYWWPPDDDPRPDWDTLNRVRDGLRRLLGRPTGQEQP